MNRGGSWNNNARNCRVANRNNNTPDNRNNNLGLRLVLQLCLVKESLLVCREEQDVSAARTMMCGE